MIYNSWELETGGWKRGIEWSGGLWWGKPGSNLDCSAGDDDEFKTFPKIVIVVQELWKELIRLLSVHYQPTKTVLAQILRPMGISSFVKYLVQFLQYFSFRNGLRTAADYRWCMDHSVRNTGLHRSEYKTCGTHSSQITSWSPQGMRVLRKCKDPRAEVMFVTVQGENIRSSHK
jgi:hypothetical protein